MHVYHYLQFFVIYSNDFVQLLENSLWFDNSYSYVSSSGTNSL